MTKHDHDGHDHDGHDHDGHDHAGHGHDHPHDAPADAVVAIKAAKPQPKRSLAMAPKPAAKPKPSSASSSSSSSGHAHGPDCDHGDHDDHAGHDHGHGHGPRGRAERPLGARPCGGAAARQLDLLYLLPHERDERGRFARLAAACAAVDGVVRVHLRADGGVFECCVHVDEAKDVDAAVAAVRLHGKAVAARYRHRSWLVKGLESAQQAANIEEVLGKTAGILQASVGYATERLTVEFDGDVVGGPDIEKLVHGLGCGLEEPEAGHVCSHHAHKGGLAPVLELPMVALAGVLLAAGFVVEKAVAGLPAWLATGLYVGALVSGGFWPARSALLALLNKKVDLETLMVLAAVGAAVLGAWFEGAFLLFLFSLGHMLEHHALDRARRAVEALEKLRPESAQVLRGDTTVEVPLKDVQRGEVVVVRPGDRVPLDGVVVDGSSTVDQAALTGESIPVPKQSGDEVWGGTVNTSGALRIEVTKVMADSALARLVDLVAEAEASKPKSQRFAKRVEKLFVPLVLLGAPALVAVLYALGTPFHDAVLRGLSLLVAASPCALAVSTPAVVLSAVARAARSGVLIKGGAHLESLATLHALALDKTGTLTEGKPRVTDVVVFAGAPVGEDELVTLAASAETLSSHPLAKAVVAHAQQKNLALREAKDGVATDGKGLAAVVDGQQVRIGNAAYFDALGAEVTSTIDRLGGQGRTTMIVAVGGAVVGVLGVMDTPRPAARATLAALKQTGIRKTVMLSGDALVVARAVAREVGVDDVRAPLLPEHKVDAIKALAKEGPVGMVGDGVNDAPALASAAVGIAMGGAGSDVALETADVVLMGDDLSQLPFAVELARTASAAVRQNLVIALGVASVLIVASVGGFVAVSQAVVLHEGSTVVVVLNGLRLLLFKHRAST